MVYVGDTCHDSTQKTVTNNGLSTGGVGKQVELWIPAYQMLPDVEMSYAQNHLRDISYHDYYQYGLKNVASGESFNHLVSNGISNLKAVLIIPQLNSLNNNVNAFDDGLPQLMGHINNFNVLLVVLMFYTKTRATPTSNSKTNSSTNLVSMAINPAV